MIREALADCFGVVALFTLLVAGLWIGHGFGL